MRLRFGLSLVIFAIAACRHEAIDPPPLIAIHHVDPAAETKLLFAAWADGTIQWTADEMHGSGELQRRRVDPARVAQALAEIRRSFEPVKQMRYAPENAAALTISFDGRTYISWHELIEENPRLVATATGVSALDAGTSIEVYMNQPPDYTRFRRAWRQTRDALRALTP